MRLAPLGFVTASAGLIDTVVVLMLENRSFDHLLGFLKKLDPRVDGCLPGIAGCVSPVDPADPSKGTVTVADGGLYVSEADPSHSIHSTTREIFGKLQQAPWPANPPMSGFVKEYDHGNSTDFGKHIMQCFDPVQVPALSTLAQEFAVFDRWFVGVPGPTMPNRAAFMSATTHGTGTNDKTKIAFGWPQKSMFVAAEEAGLDWRVYFQEVPTPLAFRDLRTPKRLLKFQQYQSFLRAAASGNLPNLSWVDPRYFGISDKYPATDQHPNHPVDEGDKLIKEVYEALRSGPKWNSTLLLVTYDEHGGWFDHVPPPAGPSPDGLNSTDDPFDFTRLGVRVPTVAVSPLIAKGTVVNKPGTGGTAAKPGSEFEASSFLATMQKLFGLKPLTKRDAWSASFEGILSQAPRTDCPTSLPNPPDHQGMLTAEGKPLPKAGETALNDLQALFLDSVAGIVQEHPDPNAVQTEAGAGAWVLDKVSQYLRSGGAVSQLV